MSQEYTPCIPYLLFGLTCILYVLIYPAGHQDDEAVGCRPSVRTGDGVSRPQGCRQAQPRDLCPLSRSAHHANPSLMLSRYANFSPMCVDLDTRKLMLSVICAIL